MKTLMPRAPVLPRTATQGSPKPVAPSNAAASAPTGRAASNTVRAGAADQFAAPVPAATAVPGASAMGAASVQVQLPDPALMDAQASDGTGQYTEVRYDGPLFGLGGPSASDIHQGVAGDCYFLSSLAALAQNEPKALKHLIYSNHDGTFTVIFHERDPSTGNFKAVPVKVDGDLYTTTASGPPPQRVLTYDSPSPKSWGDSVDTPSLWGPLLEKAYAQLKGNTFDGIGNGGWPADALEELLGRPSQSVSTTSSTPDQVWSFIQSAIDTHSPVCASTSCDPDQQDRYTNSGIVGEHAYTVMGYQLHDGERFVTLRNPWGNTEPTGNGADDGVFELPLSEFVKFYDQIDASPRRG